MKRFITIIAYVFIISSANAAHFSFQVDGLYYRILNDSSVAVTYPQSSGTGTEYYSGYTKPSGDLTIPSSVYYNSGAYSYQGRNYTVISIDNYAFYNCSNLTSVTIPNSVTSIGQSAFYSCSRLSSVTIPNFVTSIGESAFLSCSALTGALIIPDSVISIGEKAFLSCSELTSVTIGISVESIGNRAFDYCSGLTSVNFNATNCTSGGFKSCTSLRTLNIGENVTIIPSEAFKDCRNITGELYIPNSVTSIGASAFRGCSGLTGVLRIPNSIVIIDNETFYGCSGLEAVTFPDSLNSIGRSSFNNCDNLLSLDTRNVVSVGNYAFANCDRLVQVNIGDSVRSIGNSAFSGCFRMLSVNIGRSVETIGDNAFDGCERLVSPMLPESLTSIGASAFNGCSQFSGMLTLPRNLTQIGDNAYSGCSGITSITAKPINPPVISVGTFSDISNEVPVYVPCGRALNYYITDYWESFSNIQENMLYDITLLSNNNAMGNVSMTQQPSCINNTAIISAIPAEHYHFVSWNDGNTDNPRTVTIENDTTFTANFAIAQFAVIVISANETMGTVSGSGTFDYGTETQISVTPAEHYHFVSWNDGNTANPRTITVESDTSFTANFAIDQFTITVVSANETMGTVSGSGTFDYGAEIQISAIANEHYHFVQWTDGNTTNPRTITVTIDTTYTATFTEDVTNYTITAVSANPSQGIVTGGGTYPEGTVVTLTATANEGYQFLQWSDNSTENPRQITVTEDAVYVASFTETVATYTITVISANPNQGTVDGGGTYQEGAVATLTATANEGYRFLSWSDNSTENPHYITVTEDAMFIATFEVDNSQQPIYVTINETACGSYTWNDSTYTQSGEYQQTFTASTSVDSIVTLVLEIFPLPEPEITASDILDACNPSSVTLSTSNYSAYNWNTGESTETITITEPGNYFVEVVDGHGCHGYSEMLEVGYSNTLTETPQLRRVGMSNTGTNIVQWTVANTEGIAGFEIYREDNIANVYTLIQRIDRPGVRSCTDLTANPSARAYRYKICAVDECGGLSPLSEPHKTMHLTINRSLGNTWNLIWSPYEGMEFASYKIYRGSTIQNMVVIGEVPSTMNTFTDSDNPACAGFFYKVVIVANTRSDDEDEMLLGSNIVDNGLMPEYTITAVSANPNQGTVVGGGTYPEGSLVTLAAIPSDGYEFLSWSDESTENPHYITVTGNAVYVATFVPATDIKDNALPEIALFPNPAKDILNITSSETISEIEIVNVMGQVVKRIEVNADNAVCNVNNLPNGIYVVRIRTLRHAQGAEIQRKFIKE